MIHFHRPPPISRTASERIAQRRRVDMAAELRAEVNAGVAETADAPDLKSGAARREGSNPSARTNTQPWYVGNREHGEAA